ncbi:hypothetical protein EJ04DRAFT_515141 [Polyplosphaeria fusca]|uniref:Uncharacterized protein n=1 Tax=Polyplosphaeria fusca TaxID=682080 RepID=A0A9P4UZV6_9PLEO|nr:hypothetical protein EJ04DRAFT_515141 [Polyplosphaeria fusca]
MPPVSPKPFRLLELPVDILAQILEHDIATTYALVRASRRAKAVFVSNSQSILSTFLNAWPSQLRALLTSILVLRLGLIDVATADTKNVLEDFCKSAVLGEKTWPGLHALETLWALELELEILSSVFLDNCLTRAMTSFGAPNYSNYASLWYDTTAAESYRIKRTMLRVFLYLTIVDEKVLGDSVFADREVAAAFMACPAWEVEEFFTVTDPLLYIRYEANQNAEHQQSVTALAQHCHGSVLFECGNDSAIGGPTRFFSQLFFTESTHASQPYRDAPKHVECAAHGYRYPALMSSVHTVLGERTRGFMRMYGLAFWDKERLQTWKDFPDLDAKGETELRTLWMNWSGATNPQVSWRGLGLAERLKKVVAFWDSVDGEGRERVQQAEEKVGSGAVECIIHVEGY